MPTCNDLQLWTIYALLTLHNNGHITMHGKGKNGRRELYLQLSMSSHILPQFHPKIPMHFLTSIGMNCFLYKTFRSFTRDIGLTSHVILSNWENIRNTYSAWHVDCILATTLDEPTSEDEDTTHTIHPKIDMNKWKKISRLVPTGNLHINELDMLGFQYFDTNHEWNHS